MGIIKALKLGFDYFKYDDDGNIQETQRAVDEVSVDIQEGEFVAVLGHNGSGKSTFAKHINALLLPTEGTIWIDSMDTMKEPELWKIRQKAGMVFQNPDNQIIGTVVEEDVGFGPENMGIPTEDIWKRVDESLQKTGMAAYRHHSPNKLSGGQKQRVAIARALANDPKVLLCDEATSALDPQTTQSILKLLKQVNETLGITIVLITHEMAVVKDICDRVAIMEQGCVVEEGDTVSVFSHPKEAMTKDFIDTASNLGKIHDLIAEGHSLTEIQPGEQMVLLTYSGSNAGQPLISALAEKFGVSANIIYGNIDYLKGKPLGKLVVTLSGEKEAMDQAIEYIRSLGVEMEVIKR